MPSNPQQTIHSSSLVFIYILFSYIIAHRSKFCWYRKCYVYHLYVVYLCVQLFPFDMCLWFNTNFLFDSIFFIYPNETYLYTLYTLPSWVRIFLYDIHFEHTPHTSNATNTIFYKIIWISKLATRWRRTFLQYIQSELRAIGMQMETSLVSLRFIVMNVGDSVYCCHVTRFHWDKLRRKTNDTFSNRLDFILFCIYPCNSFLRFLYDCVLGCM